MQTSRATLPIAVAESLHHEQAPVQSPEGLDRMTKFGACAGLASCVKQGCFDHER